MDSSIAMLRELFLSCCRLSLRDVRSDHNDNDVGNIERGKGVRSIFKLCTRFKFLNSSFFLLWSPSHILHFLMNGYLIIVLKDLGCHIRF